MQAGSASLLTCLLVAYISTSVESSLDVGLDRYEDMLMQNLYKRLSQIDSSYLLNELNDEPQDEYRSSHDEGTTNEEERRQSEGAAIRDFEYIQHSSNAGSDGFIHMSGGAGEGKQHLKPDGSIDNIKAGGIPPVKSDESLPFYCHPPNPCPKGMTSDNGCQDGIEDSADVQKEWINNMQLHGYCSCDHEHMFNCPNVHTSPNNLMVDTEKAFGVVMDKILADKAAATYMSGEKRITLVAKKSPRVKRGVSAENMEQELRKVSLTAQQKRNPYLQGQPLRTVAKKGGIQQ